MTVSSLPAGSRLLAELLDPLVDEINARGLKGFAERTSNSSGSTGTEVGVLRLDDIPLTTDRSYRIETSNLRLTGGANDNVTVRLRATTDGSTPSISSTLIGEASADIDDVGTFEHAAIRVRRQPIGAETFSVLLTVIRAAGAAGTASLGGASTYPIQVSIVDEGPAVSDTGVDI